VSGRKSRSASKHCEEVPIASELLIPILVSFGEFAKAHGASEVKDLPDHLEPFVEAWVSERAGGRRSARRRKQLGDEVRNPVRQMLRLAVPGYMGGGVSTGLIFRVRMR
jgi:hypothetical protein